MNSNVLIYIAIGIVILGVALFLLKSLVKAAILTVVIMVIFRIGWVYSSDDMIRIFRLDNVLYGDKVTEFRIGYDDYVERRNADPIIAPEELDETVRLELQRKVEEYLNKVETAPNN